MGPGNGQGQPEHAGFCPVCFTQLPGTPPRLSRETGSTRNRSNVATDESGGLDQSRLRTPVSVQQAGPVGEVRGWSGDGLWVKASGVLRKEGGPRIQALRAHWERRETRRAWGAGQQVRWGGEASQGQRPPWQSPRRLNTGSECPLCALLGSGCSGWGGRLQITVTGALQPPAQRAGATLRPHVSSGEPVPLPAGFPT